MHARVLLHLNEILQVSLQHILLQDIIIIIITIIIIIIIIFIIIIIIMPWHFCNESLWAQTLIIRNVRWRVWL